MADLTERSCIPCKGGVPPLGPAEIAPLAAQLPAWSVVESHHLERRWKLKDFAEALDLVNRIGAVAERENHHPDLSLGWGFAAMKIWTHKIDGLTESDFVLAAKAERAYEDMKKK